MWCSETQPSMRQTCDGFDYAVRNLRDLLIHRNTQHLNGDPVQGPVIKHSVLQSKNVLQHAAFYLQQDVLVIDRITASGVMTTFVYKPDPLLNGQVFILIVGRFWTKGLLVETSHHVLLHFIHNTLHLIR